jgi:YD repeat-containing protein
MGQTTTFQYYNPSTAQPNLLQKIIRPLGNSHLDQIWGNNPSGTKSVVSQKDAYGNEITLTYSQDADGNYIGALTRPDGSTRSYLHENRRTPMQFTDEAGRQINIQNNDSGQITQFTDRSGNASTTSYHEASGKPAGVTNLNGNGYNFTYTPQDQAITNPANNDQVTFTFYNVTRIDYPDGSYETFTHDGQGNILTATDANGQTWTRTYTRGDNCFYRNQPPGRRQQLCLQPGRDD